MQYEIIQYKLNNNMNLITVNIYQIYQMLSTTLLAELATFFG